VRVGREGADGRLTALSTVEESGSELGLEAAAIFVSDLRPDRDPNAGPTGSLRDTSRAHSGP
jgi:hypothetical protein